MFSLLIVVHCWAFFCKIGLTTCNICIFKSFYSSVSVCMNKLSSRAAAAVLTEVSSEEATQMTSTSRRISRPRSIRLRCAAGPLWELIRFMMNTHSIRWLHVIHRQMCGSVHPLLSSTSYSQDKLNLLFVSSYISNQFPATNH